MDYYKKAAEIKELGEKAAICTIVRAQGSTPRGPGAKMIVLSDGEIMGTIGGGEAESRVIEEALAAMQTGRPRMLTYNLSDPGRGDPGICGGTFEIYVEPIMPEPTVVIIGAGHVGKAVAHLAGWLGFRVVVSDDRPEFATKESVPGGDEYYSLTAESLIEQITVHTKTYVVMTTRNSQLDVDGLPAWLESPAAYIGVIGSKRRWQVTVDKLLEKGIAGEKLGAVSSPMGLDLNAETPEEIALSIMAEIVQLHLGGEGGRMADGE